MRSFVPALLVLWYMAHGAAPRGIISSDGGLHIAGAAEITDSLEINEPMAMFGVSNHLSDPTSCFLSDRLVLHSVWNGKETQSHIHPLHVTVSTMTIAVHFVPSLSNPLLTRMSKRSPTSSANVYPRKPRHTLWS